MAKLIVTKQKQQKAEKTNELSKRDYAKFLAKNGMAPTQDTIEEAKGETKKPQEEMTDVEYEKFLIKEGMRPANYVEED